MDLVEKMSILETIVGPKNQEDFLLWFYYRANFGPEDTVRRRNMLLDYLTEIGKELPEEYQEEEV